MAGTRVSDLVFVSRKCQTVCGSQRCNSGEYLQGANARGDGPTFRAVALARIAALPGPGLAKTGIEFLPALHALDLDDRIRAAEWCSGAACGLALDTIQAQNYPPVDLVKMDV